MRHRMRGRKLGRTPSHRKAMFKNMAASLIKTLHSEEGEEGAPKVPGRIVTTVAKAKELRPFVEKLITLAKKAQKHEANAQEHATSAERGTSEWKTWRTSNEWSQWAQAMAPAVNYRRRAFAMLRDKEAVTILFSTLAERFEDRNGGYTRIVQLAKVRLGDAGAQALIEFVGERDRVKAKRVAPVVVDDDETEEAPAIEEASAESPVADVVESEETATIEATATEEAPVAEESEDENIAE